MRFLRSRIVLYPREHNPAIVPFDVCTAAYVQRTVPPSTGVHAHMQHTVHKKASATKPTILLFLKLNKM